MTIKRNIQLLYLINFFLDFRFYAPIMIIYLSQVTGSFVLAMSIFSAVTISSAIFEVPTGVFSDFLGRKGTVILGAAFGTLAGLSYALGFSYWVLLLGGIFEGVSRSFFSGKLIKKFGELKLLILGELSSRVIGFIAYGFPTIFSPALTTTTSFFYGVEQTSKNTLLQKEFTDHQRASMASLNSLALNIFLGVFAIILGAYADKFGPTSALVFANVLLLPVIFIYAKLFRQKK